MCLGDSITWRIDQDATDNGGIQRVLCIAKTAIDPVTPTYTWVITKPDGTMTSGSGKIATIVTDIPGLYNCTFTASIPPPPAPNSRECPPPALTIDAGTATADLSATLTLSPSSIAATTGWTGMPSGLNESTIQVVWNPPECEGTLQIVEVEPIQGYTPPAPGTLTQNSASEWVYTAFDEPQNELCPKWVKVWIAAMQGNTELQRVSIIVRNVHDYWTQTATRNFQNDYYYLIWKYATVHATTMGSFTFVTISPSPRIACGNVDLAYACTTLDPDNGNYSVLFGTDTLASSENQAASIIGHELVHTVVGPAVGECPSYQWEKNSDAATGIFPCDSTYLDEVRQQLFNRGCP